MRKFLIAIFCVLLNNIAHTQVLDSTATPNVILIVVDDMGWNDVGYHGSEIKTPTMDRLAKEGVELDRFYVHPTCSPTRSSLMTGKAALRLGFLNPLGKNYVKGLPLTEKIMPQYFKEVGYQTHLVGKWHLGRYTEEYWPQNRGFDNFYGYLTGGVGHYDHVHGGGLDWQRNGENLEEDGYSTHLLTKEAISIIENKPADQPLFLEVCYAAPHLPNEAPSAAIDQYTSLPDSNRQIHAAMVSEVDRGIQEIYETLASKNLLDNTIIWFTSDNGGLNASAVSQSMKDGVDKIAGILGTPIPIEFLEFFRDNIVNGAADNSPLKRGKGSIYEGGVRVPAFIYAPSFLSSNKIDSRLTVNDVLPTLAGAVGFDFSPDITDGNNQWDFISGKTTQAIQSDHIVHSIDAEAYYKDNWKLIVPSEGPHELYQIADDPEETINLYDQHTDIAKALLAAYESFPRGEPIDDPMWKTFMDMDKFGGKVDRQPYAGLEGVNKGPLHPIYIIVPLFILSIIGLIWWRRKRKRDKQKGAANQP